MMRAIATTSAAGGLRDDVAIIELGAETLILTHDMMVQGIHWLPNANPADVAWKLLAVNLSDLAAKGAEPLGVLLGFMLGDDDWDIAFASGLQAALAHYGVALLGGDTVGGGDGPRTLGMTALGRAILTPVPMRINAKVGDTLYVTGTLGNAKAGFDLESGAVDADKAAGRMLRAAFNRPAALLTEGQKLVPFVHAMMDVSDGLFIDAQRMADASGLALGIDISKIPLSAEYAALCGDNLESRMEAGSWGDDYQLLFACADDVQLPVAATKIGDFTMGDGLTLLDQDRILDLPASLGFEHR